MCERIKLPDGSDFEAWQDDTVYGRVYHVAQNHPAASDENPGTTEFPWKSVGKAAGALKPGEKVIVHEGVYREWVKPERGGTSCEEMIRYEAASGENAEIRGSDVWKPEWKKSEYFKLKDPIVTWQASLSADMFEGANPFCLDNFPPQEDRDTWKMFPSFELRRGQIFADGAQLVQVPGFDRLAEGGGRFWVEDNGMTVHVRLAGDAAPETKLFEVTTREQVFAPVRRYLNYIRVSGLRMFHAANGVPIPPPQRGLLSAAAGHHWIVEDCEIGYANTLGMDLGGQWWSYGKGERQGFHIIRRNHIHHCGVSSISAWHNMANENILVEDNLITDNCWMPIHDHYESAGVKIHRTENSLIRRNVILRTANGPSLWLDGEIRNTRITQNLFVGVENSSLGMVFLEINLGTNLVDNNLFIGSGGHGFYEHDAERAVIVQNLFTDIRDAAVYLSPGNPERTGRPYENHHRIYGNIVVRAGRRIEVPNSTTKSDCNLFAAKEGEDVLKGFGLSVWKGKYPLSLSQWKQMGYDENSVIRDIRADFSEDDLTLAVETPDAEALPKFPVLRDILPGMADSDILLTEDFFGNPRSPSVFQIGPFCNPKTAGGPMPVGRVRRTGE